MKKILLPLLLSIANTFVFAQGFTVNNFTADIYLHEDGYFEVVENYDVEFLEMKHGIFREIITDYQVKSIDGKTEKRHLVIDNITVPGHPFKLNAGWERRMENKITIKIGDKNQLLTGLQHYEIRYRVYNAFLFEDSIVQFYWNLKPSGWLAIFKQVNFHIHTPEGTVLSAENCFVYAGNKGTTVTSPDFDYSYADNVFSAKSHEIFFSAPGQDVTVLVKLPKKTIQEQFVTAPLWERWGWVWILCLLFLITFIINRIYGKPKKVIAVTSYYPPKGMDPAMAGILIDKMANSRDIISLLPYWATQGIIRMEAIEKGERSLKDDLKLIKLRELPEDAPGYAYNFFNKIFSSANINAVLTSSLVNIISEPRMLLMNKFKSVFQQSRSPVKKTWGCMLGLWAIGGSILFFFVWTWVAAIVNLLVSVFFSIMTLLRERNREGNEAFSALLGFKQFIKMAEVERIKVLLKDDPLYFEKTMPYAVAFNLLKEWTAKFEGLIRQQPEWYSSSSGTLFTMTTFAHSFSSSMAVASATMLTSPSNSGSSSSSGGGSSGGGFGGGGGGSW